MKPVRLLSGPAAAAAVLLAVSCMRDRVVTPDTPLPAVLAVDRPTVQLFRFARGRMVAADTVRISNNGEGRLGPVQRLGGVDYQEGRSGWLNARVINVDDNTALLVLEPGYADEEQEQADRAEVVLKGAGATDFKRVTIFARTLPGAKFEFSVSPAAFTAAPGEPPASQTLVVRNGGNGVLRIQPPAIAYDGAAAGWLSVVRAGGTETAPAYRLQADPTGLPAGLHQAHLRFESLPAEETRALPGSIGVLLNVGTPRLGVSTSRLSYTVVYGEGAPPAQTVALSNAGAGSFPALGKVQVTVLNYGPGATGWLSAAVDSGRTVVAAQPAGIRPGSYTASLGLHSENGGDQAVQAELRVEAPVLTLSSRSLSFGLVKGEAALPSPLAVRATNSGAGSVGSLGTITIGALSPAAPWLTAAVSGTDLNLALTAAAANLAVGSYATRLAVNSAFGGSDTLAVTLAVSRGADVPALVLSATEVSFSAIRGGSSPAAQAVRVSNAGGGSLGAIALGPIAYTGASGWLTAALRDTTVTLAVDAGGLSNGTYQASVRVTSPGGPEDSVRVTLTVVSPILTVSTSSVSFSSQVGGAAGASRNVVISNTGPGSFSTLGAVSVGAVSYSQGSGWLSASLSGQTLTLAIAAVPAAPGSYSAVVPVTSGNGGVASIQVAFTVAAAPTAPVLVVSPTTVSLYAVEGSGSTETQQVLLSNGGGGSLGALSVSPGSAPWLTASLSGTTLTLNAATAGLGAGTHHATVTVSSAAGGSEAIAVVLEVKVPRLTLSSRSASFQAVQGSGAASPGVYSIAASNTGGGDFQSLGGVSLGAIAYQGAGSWLTASLVGSSTINLTAGAGSLAEGTYSASVPVSSGKGGADAIQVTLTVSPVPAAPDLKLSSGGASFTTSNGSNPADQYLTVTNAGGGGFAELGAITIGNITYGAGASGWLAASATADEIRLSPTTGSLANGSYTASFTVSSAAGGSEPVSVQFDVVANAAPPVLGLGTAGVGFTAVAGDGDPAGRDVAVINLGAGNLGQIALGTIAYGAGASGWLAGSSVNNNELRLAVTLGSIAPGSYTATVPVSSQNGGSISASVTLQVGQPRLTVSTRSASFAGSVGGGSPPGQTIQVTNSGAGTYQQLGTVAVGAVAYGAGATGWLAANLAGGQITLQPSLSGVAPGTFQATLPVSSTAGGSETIGVTLTVAEASETPALALGAATVKFVAVAGAPAPAAGTIALSNSGGGGLVALGSLSTGTISYHGGASGWLGTPQIANGALTLTPATDGIATGSYTATVPVRSQNGGNQSLGVTLDVVQPVLTASTLAMSFTALAGGASPAAQTLTLANTGGGNFADLGAVSVQSVSYDAGTGWLGSPGAGAGLGSTVDFAVTPAGLAPGLYGATVVLASQYGGSQAVTVSLSVVRDTDPPRLALSASTLRFSALVGGSAPEPQAVELANAGGGTLGILSVGAPSYTGTGGWLNAHLTGTTLTVGAETDSLAKGNYLASLPVTSSGGGIATLAVNLVVGSPRLTVTPATVSFADTVGGSGPPPAIVKVANTGGGGIGSLGNIEVASVVYAGGGAGWLTAQAMDTSLTLAAHTTGLTARPAPYEARVLLSSRYGGEDTVAVAFSVALGAAPPRLALSLDSLRLAGIIGQPTPPPQSVSGFNAGGGVLGALSVSDVVYQPAGTSWLNTAVTGEVVTFSPDPAGLRAGQYRATVTVSSAAGGNDSLHVSLDLGQPVLGLSTRSVTFSDTVGSREVLRSQVFVSNGGSGARSDLGRIEVGTVTYSGGGSNWLHTSPASGQTVDGFVATLEAAAADVPEGTSIARVPFLSQWGSSDTVTVTLVARRPDRSFDLPTIELVRTTIVNGSPVVERLPGDSLVVTASAHSPAQVGVRLGIRNSAETRLTLSGLRVGMPSYIAGKGDWISGAFLNRTSATLADPAELFVAIEPAALDAGRYEAQLVVRSEAAGLAQVQPVTLRLVLRVQ